MIYMIPSNTLYIFFHRRILVCFTIFRPYCPKIFWFIRIFNCNKTYTLILEFY